MKHFIQKSHTQGLTIASLKAENARMRKLLGEAKEMLEMLDVVDCSEGSTYQQWLDKVNETK